ncbi:hypothetical protein C0580_01135 [Candidatus Parcubacteria bacterium]|nr:MAG: hypothetical protein C0580_01135 [Candidatus Parcubacteria bacterium]
MPNFNKFLKNKEVLKLEIKPKKSIFRFYFILFLLLVMFFLMFPLWRAGEMGIFLWFAGIFMLIFALSRQLLSSKDRYLLTNKRIIHLRAINKQNYNLLGSIKISELKEIGVSGFSSLYLLRDGRKIYMTNIEDRDKVFSKIEAYLKA